MPDLLLEVYEKPEATDIRTKKAASFLPDLLLEVYEKPEATDIRTKNFITIFIIA